MNSITENNASSELCVTSEHEAITDSGSRMLD